MANSYFQFKQFRIDQANAGMKVGVDSVVLGAWVKLSKPQSILDIGTGTGLLALMMAQRSPESQIVAVELDKDAVLDARYNFQHSSFASRIDLVHAAIQDFAMLTDRRFDLIISNPPYFDNGNRSDQTSRSAARHQDELCLEDLISLAAGLLNPHGRLALIIPHNQEKKVVTLAKASDLDLYARLTIFPSDKKAPHRCILQFACGVTQAIDEHLVIRENGQYTAEYKTLTKDFYLNTSP